VRVNSAQSTCRTRVTPSQIANFTRQDFARAFGHDRRGIIRFPEYRRFLTPEAIQRLARLYERDFARLGYEPVVPWEQGVFSRLQNLVRPG
jgi:hypothetical protein